MPQKTFFNLSNKKKETIVAAAVKEFARVPFSEASIANIVKDAKISRGSFYQYFVDKEDLFFYLLNNRANENKMRFINCLKKTEGDIFKTMLEIFQQMLAEFDDENLRNFHHNVFLHLNYKTEKTLVNNISDLEVHKKYNEIKLLINTTNLNIENDEQLFHVIQIISTIMIQNFVFKFAKELSNDEVINNFREQLKLMRRGFEKTCDD